MTITASTADRNAYAQLGGAIDQASGAYTYASQVVKLLDTSGRWAKFLKVSGTAKKAVTYVRRIQEVLDERKRQGGLLKLGIEISMDVAEKVLGTSLKTHPYYAYHKAQIEALADVLNAHENSQQAVEAFRRAVAAANSEKITEAFKQIESRKVELVAQRSRLIDNKLRTALDLVRGMYHGKMVQQKIAEFGSEALVDALLELDAWRANWAGLCFDAMQLQIMTVHELNAATEAMKEVEKRLAEMSKGSSANRVGGGAARNKIEWEKYDHVVRQKKPQQAAMDPIQYASSVSDKAAAWARALGEMCDFVRTHEMMFNVYFNRELDRLNAVLYR